MTGTEGEQLSLPGLKFSQLIGPSGSIATVPLLQGDHSTLLQDGVLSLAHHQLQCCPQARIVEIVDELVEVGTQGPPSGI